MEDVRILIVDDEEDIIEFLKYNLEKEAFIYKKFNVQKMDMAYTKNVLCFHWRK